MKDNFENIKKLVEAMEVDFEKFEQKGNVSAGKRVRKSSLEIQKLLKVLRKDIIENINA